MHAGRNCAAERTQSVSDETPPHCDPKVLHTPGTCVYCDQCPGLQFERIDKGIAFTNEPDDDHVRELTPCPATLHRPRGVIELWPGNRPMPKGEGMAYIVMENVDLSKFAEEFEERHPEFKDFEYYPTPRWVRIMWLAYYLCGLAAVGYLAKLLWP